MYRHTALLAAGLTATLALAPGALAQEIVLYDGNDETQPFLSGDDNIAGGFTFDDFGGAAFTDGPDAFTIAANDDLDGSNGIFGGVGRDVIGGATFDAAASTATVTFRPTGAGAGPGDNEFRLILQDGIHQFQYGLNLADAAAAANGFYTATVSLSANDPANLDDDLIFFVGGGPQDAVPDFGLIQWQLQAEFASPNPVNVEISRIAINDSTVIPEPASLALLGAGGLALLGRRRRG